MSVLFQALNRASGDYRQQQKTEALPFLSLSGRSPRVLWKRRLGLFLGIVVVFVAGACGRGFWEGATPMAEKPSLGVVGAFTAKPPAEPERRNEEAERPPSADLAEGITLSDASLSEIFPESEVSAVAKKIKDHPAITGKTTGSARLEVFDDNALAALSRDAYTAITAGDYIAALDFYDKILAQQSDNYAALSGKAYALQQKGRLKESILINRKLLKRSPSDRLVRTNLVSALAALDAPEAQTELRRIIKNMPSFGPAQAALAKSLSAQGKLEEAIVYQTRAVEIEPQNTAYKLGLAVLCDHAEKTDEALSLYQQVLDARKETEGSLPLAWASIEQRIEYLSSHLQR